MKPEDQCGTVKYLVMLWLGRTAAWSPVLTSAILLINTPDVEGNLSILIVPIHRYINLCPDNIYRYLSLKEMENLVKGSLYVDITYQQICLALCLVKACIKQRKSDGNIENGSLLKLLTIFLKAYQTKVILSESLSVIGGHDKKREVK